MCEFVSMCVCEFDLVSSDLKTSRGKSFFFVRRDGRCEVSIRQRFYNISFSFFSETREYSGIPFATQESCIRHLVIILD